MKKIQAYLNHGRWIANCPQCAELGLTVAKIVTLSEIFVCPEEYPDTMANTLVPNPRMQGAFNSVPDHILQIETRRRAIAEGNVYEIIFPDDKAQIESVLRRRPVHARNWDPATTLEELHNENVRNGVVNA